jgi:hypothetical protein
MPAGEELAVPALALKRPVPFVPFPLYILLLKAEMP